MIRHALPTLAVGLAIAVTAAAQPADNVPTNDVAAELAKLNTTLEKVQALLEQQLETQTLDLLLKRAQLVSSEVTQLDSQLRKAQSRRDSLQDERLQIETSLSSFRANRADYPQEEVDTTLRQLEVTHERIDVRLAEAEAEVVELQARLARKREDLEGWQDLLDRRLGGV